MDLFRNLGNRDVGGIGQVFDQQPQIVLQIGSGDTVPAGRIRAIFGDTETNVVECIGTIRFDLCIQFFSQLSLFDLLCLGGKSGQLIS